jgi:exodeoxyribonuclease VII small subunit
LPRPSAAIPSPPRCWPACCRRPRAAKMNRRMPSFEESLRKLETIVDQLEKGDLTLEDSLKLFEEGVGLSAACKQELDAAEGKVQMLIKARDGSFKTEPFPDEK